MAKLARSAAPYRCTDCGWTAAKWVGRCGECQAWGTVTELAATAVRAVAAGPVTAPARPIGEVSVEQAEARSSGLSELDRVLGGGFVPGSVVLLAGEPGIGKSTLLLEVAARTGRTLYVSGEESAEQIRLRAERIGAIGPDLFLATETDLGAILTHLEDVRPQLVIVDSIQTMSAAEVEGAAGGVTQIRQVATVLSAAAKAHGATLVLVGHVTKDGSIAGPRVLEHLVDVVLHAEGDRHSRLRLLRAVKNRYGATDEIGCFDLSETGMTCLPDPSGFFLSPRDILAPGTCVTVTLEGRRPLTVEVQALGATSALSQPRRATNGFDSARVAMVLAVLERRGQLPLAALDLYTSTLGGVRLTEPASDLALALAVASAVRDQPLPRGLAAVGEVSLSGEIRPVPAMDRRLSELARLGFDKVIAPPGAGPGPADLTVREAPQLSDALRLAFSH